MITLALDDGLFRRVLAHGEDGSAVVVANKVVTPFRRLTKVSKADCKLTNCVAKGKKKLIVLLFCKLKN